jgi:Spy/CpxP family protein refolding chaperone
MSLDTLGVTADQRSAIQKVQADLRAKLEPANAAERKVVALLADGIAAGRIDRAKVDLAIADVGRASSGVHAAIVNALNQLHAVLKEAQRAALVDKVEAHWQVWKEANAGGKAAAEPREHGHLEALTHVLARSAWVALVRERARIPSGSARSLACAAPPLRATTLTARSRKRRCSTPVPESRVAAGGGTTRWAFLG